MAAQLGHEALAETHDLAVALALRVEVAAALAAAHGQTGQTVFEDLLKAEELDDGGADGGMQAQAALVGAYRGVELHAEAAVDLDLAAVVHPGDAELHEAFRLDYAVEDSGVDQILTSVGDGGEGFEHFADGLEELFFSGVTLRDALVKLCEICVFDFHGILPFSRGACALFFNGKIIAP